MQMLAKRGKGRVVTTTYKTTQVAARVPIEIKEQAALIANEYGLGLGDAVRMFVTRIAKEKRIPLDISTPLTSIADFDQIHPEYQSYINEIAEEYLYE